MAVHLEREAQGVNEHLTSIGPSLLKAQTAHIYRISVDVPGGTPQPLDKPLLDGSEMDFSDAAQRPPRFGGGSGKPTRRAILTTAKAHQNGGQ